MWAYESVFYQIFPQGFCNNNDPFFNDGVERHGILDVINWIDHFKKLNINAIYFSPVFESDSHGYNTRDYKLIDKRLGSNEDFKKVCDSLHEAGIKVVLDGVFNHCGRGFGPFLDVIEKKWDSPYKDWFYISFDGNSNYNDGFWYEGWEGNYDLVKLNLDNPAVSDYLIDAVKYWIEYFGIDGIRLDVAYMLNENFIRRLRYECDQLSDDFFLVGEMLHGDYNRLVNDEMLDSCTNYECYKGLYSSFNSNNMFEIIHSLMRQYGPEEWTLYKGKHLMDFVDNHDVSRIATMLDNPRNLFNIYTLLFGMPGIPCIYYGSEWGVQGDKNNGDPSLRPKFEAPEWTELTDHIAKLAQIKKDSRALNYGDFTNLHLTNMQSLFFRKADEDTLLVAINIDDNPCTIHADFRFGRFRDLLTGEEIDMGGGFNMEGNRSYILQPF